jgi:hypothetical protein
MDSYRKHRLEPAADDGGKQGQELGAFRLSACRRFTVIQSGCGADAVKSLIS